MAQTPNNDIAQQQLELALNVARISIDSAERLLQLQLAATKNALEDSAKTAARLSDIKDVQSAMAVRSELAEQTLESVMGLSRSAYEVATQAQAEFAKLNEARVSSLQQNLMSGFDKLGRVAPVNSDMLSTTLKSSLAASQAAFDSLNKASRQIAEFADASLKAATTATAEAVKNSTRTK